MILNQRGKVIIMQPINRKVLKENGKIALKRNFWMIMLVVLVGTILGANWTGLGGSSAGSSVSSQISSSIGRSKAQNSDYTYHPNASIEENMDNLADEICEKNGWDRGNLAAIILTSFGVLILVCVLISLCVIVFQFAMGSFLYAPIGVGYNRFFMKNRNGDSSFNDLFAVFGKGRYMSVVKAMFSTNIRIFGWSLLFYIPGLIKYYEYYFVSYILSENPGISGERAREISRQMTTGHKWQMFVLDLSFMGWSLLAFLLYMVIAICSCCILAIPGVAVMYPVTGYIMVTYAELYAERREYALMTGIASSSELVGYIEPKEEI